VLLPPAWQEGGAHGESPRITIDQLVALPGSC
jgi:hypothetical protein